MALTELGIDERVAQPLHEQGIESLYPPQQEAWEALRGGRNTMVAIPTASGKSLIAYLAILHRWLKTGQKALYIVPLRALASEKFEELQAWKHLGLKVALATGDLDESEKTDKRLGNQDVIVCTSEKADSLLRHRTGWVDQIGCVVADEVHLLNDPGRGPTLEVLLTRFRAILPEAQIVGLSATVANARDMAAWLDADLVTSTWRPVSLKTGTYFGDNLEFLQEDPRRLPAGGDPVASLVEDAIEAGGQSLVFVSTRRSAEAQATKLAGPVRGLLDAAALARLEEAAEELGDDDSGPTAKKLQKLVKAGVAYHTAGLDAKQRRFVEQRFRAGDLKVLCATPTLAAGVNTPARRVIIRDMTRFEMGAGVRPLPVMEVHQMMGRAGRPRYDPYGEAVLIAKDGDMKQALVEEYLLGAPEPVSSKLAADAALRIHTLASIAGRYCGSQKELESFFGHTFWAQQTQDWILRDRIEDTLWFLEENGFIEADGGRLKTTLFGQRTSDLYVDPLSALRMKRAMEADTDAPPAFGVLHTIAGCPDLYPLYLRQSDGWVQELYYERFADLLIQDEAHEDAFSHTKTATLLWDWMEELPLPEMEKKYQVGPGDIRLRVDTAKWMLHAMRELCRALRADWTHAVNELVLRLEHGIRAELLPLIKMRGVGRIRARTLHRAGFRTPAKLKGTPVATLARLPGIGDRLARELLQQVGDDVDAQPKAPAKEKAQEPDGKESDEEPEGQSGLQRWGMTP